MKQPKQSSPVFALILFVLLLGCILGLVVAGSGLYGSLVNRQVANNSHRASLSYLSTRLYGADQLGAVSIANGPEGSALILQDEDSGYETQIYLYDGSLVEGYQATGSPLEPSAAQAVAKTDVFSLEKQGNLYSLTTDAGTVKVYLHCGGNGQ